MTTNLHFFNFFRLVFLSFQGTENIDGYAPNITKIWKQQKSCSFREPGSQIPNTKNRLYVTETDINIVDGITITELDENNIIEGAARSKVSRSSAASELLLLSLSGTSPFSSISLSKSYPLVLILCLLFCNSFRISLLQLAWTDYQLLVIQSSSLSSFSSASSWYRDDDAPAAPTPITCTGNVVGAADVVEVSHCWWYVWIWFCTENKLHIHFITRCLSKKEF